MQDEKMTKSFNELAGELKDFIVDEHSNYRGIKNISLQRYNNLRVGMNVNAHALPHVVVKIGISEGVYLLPHGTKIIGGLGMDERFVLKWLCKSNVISELDSKWQLTQLHFA